MVCRPTASSRRQISGTSSIPIQCSWMFCRSEMSAVSAGELGGDARRCARSWSVVDGAAVDADPQHEVAVARARPGRARRCGCRRCPGGAGCTGPTSGAGRAGRRRGSSRSPRRRRSPRPARRTFRPLSSALNSSLWLSGVVAVDGPLAVGAGLARSAGHATSWVLGSWAARPDIAGPGLLEPGYLVGLRARQYAQHIERQTSHARRRRTQRGSVRAWADPNMVVRISSIRRPVGGHRRASAGSVSPGARVPPAKADPWR